MKFAPASYLAYLAQRGGGGAPGGVGTGGPTGSESPRRALWGQQAPPPADPASSVFRSALCGGVRVLLLLRADSVPSGSRLQSRFSSAVNMKEGLAASKGISLLPHSTGTETPLSMDSAM